MIRSASISQLLVAMAFAAALAFLGLASAGPSKGDYVGKTAAEITESLEQQGYKVVEIEREHGNLEAKVVLDGKWYEIYADPRTGKIVEIAESSDELKKRGSFILIAASPRGRPSGVTARLECIRSPRTVCIR